MNHMTSLLITALLSTGAVTTAFAKPGNKVLVVNDNDSGPGSFRAAIDAANADSKISRILFAGSVSTIVLQQTVLFTGEQPLEIDGNGATLDGAGAGGPAFRATGGGNLEFSNLIVRNAPAEGIAIEVPSDETGVVHVSLFKVGAIGNKGHGVLVNDQVDPSTTDGVPPNPNGSAASIDVSVVQSRFINNGYSVSDRDGLRVNEGGEGDLHITVRRSASRDNAADGIEVDERGDGDVLVDVSSTEITGNGRFDPEDLDDGFDIDEYGPGSIIGTFSSSLANNNYEEGFDVNENDAGDLRVDMHKVEASGNGEEGIDYEEDDDFAGGGDLVTELVDVTANGNGVANDGDAGLKIREKGIGNLDAKIDDATTSGNLIGGISVREDDVGNLVSAVRKATSRSNATIGVGFEENGEGNLSAAVRKSTALQNTEFDLSAEQEPGGTGSFVLNKVSYGTVGGNVPPTIIKP